MKSCFLARMPLIGWVFQEKVKIDECRTHDFEKLVELAGLKTELFSQFAISATPTGVFTANWDIANRWTVDSRYTLAKTEQEANDLFAAISDQLDGVLAWIMTYW